jgi:hypothetical protein
MQLAVWGRKLSRDTPTDSQMTDEIGSFFNDGTCGLHPSLLRPLVVGGLRLKSYCCYTKLYVCFRISADQLIHSVKKVGWIAMPFFMNHVFCVLE